MAPSGPVPGFIAAMVLAAGCVGPDIEIDVVADGSGAGMCALPAEEIALVDFHAGRDMVEADLNYHFDVQTGSGVMVVRNPDGTQHQRVEISSDGANGSLTIDDPARGTWDVLFACPTAPGTSFVWILVVVGTEIHD